MNLPRCLRNKWQTGEEQRLFGARMGVTTWPRRAELPAHPVLVGRAHQVVPGDQHPWPPLTAADGRENLAGARTDVA